MITAALRRDLKVALDKHGMELYEDDGMWCMLDANYDRATLVFYPRNAPKQHLPDVGVYTPAVNW